MDLWEEIELTLNELDNLVSDLRTQSRDYANAYKRYRVLLSQKLLQLKASGMPATICYDVARGQKEIADAKEQEIIKGGLYKSCLEAINVYKIKIKVLNNQYEREWGQSKNG